LWESKLDKAKPAPLLSFKGFYRKFREAKLADAKFLQENSV
jgi:hypothetical protein